MNCHYRLINGSEPDSRPSNEQQAGTRDFVVLCRGGDVRQNDIKDTCSPAGREEDQMIPPHTSQKMTWFAGNLQKDTRSNKVREL